MSDVIRTCEFCSATYYWQPASAANFLKQRIRSSYSHAVTHARGQGWFISEGSDGERDFWYCDRCTERALVTWARGGK